MKSFLAVLVLMLCISNGRAQEPGEGDCSSEFIHKITKVQKCDGAGRCNSRNHSKLTFAGILSCGAPWGEFYRVCFEGHACVVGKVSMRKTSEGDVIYTSILNNPSGHGGYPKKFAVIMSTHMRTLPTQLVLMGADTNSFTELLFGELDVASLTGKSAKNKNTAIPPAFFRRPVKPVEAAD